MKLYLILGLIFILNNSFAKTFFKFGPVQKYSVKTYDFSENFQGVAQNEDFWFLSQKSYLWKVSKNSFPYPDKIQKVGIEKSELELGFNHYSDLDFYQGHIIIPLEGPKSQEFVNKYPQRLLMFNEELREIGRTHFPPSAQRYASWVAIDHRNGDVYSSNFRINKTNPLIQYSSFDPEEDFLKVKEKMTLYDSSGSILKLPRVQGGVFIKNTPYLVLVNDVKHGGVVIINVDTQMLVARKYLDFCPGFPDYEELEGVSYKEDLTSRKNNNGVYEFSGTLTVGLLDNRIIKDGSSLFNFKITAGEVFLNR